jgi:hypothetical protein
MTAMAYRDSLPRVEAELDLGPASFRLAAAAVGAGVTAPLGVLPAVGGALIGLGASEGYLMSAEGVMRYDGEGVTPDPAALAEVARLLDAAPIAERRGATKRRRQR